MKLPVSTICPSCNTPSYTEYIDLGAATKCSACGEHTVQKVPLGGTTPVTGYEIRFADFIHLVSYSPYKSEILPLLAEKLGYTIPEPLDPDALYPIHCKIQNNSEARYMLYQAAMTLWR